MVCNKIVSDASVSTLQGVLKMKHRCGADMNKTHAHTTHSFNVTAFHISYIEYSNSVT